MIIDVSHHQGTINWRAVKDAGVTAAIVKATEGRSYIDPEFRRNWSEMALVGVRRFAYHFARPNSSPADNADHFVATVKSAGFGASDGLALDIENHPLDSWTDNVAAGDPSVRWILACLERIDGLVGRHRSTLFYCYPAFLSGVLHSDHRLSLWPLWIAHYTTRSSPDAPWPWALWQYSSSGTVPGVSGRCDVNREGPLWGQVGTDSETTNKIEDSMAAILFDITGHPGPIYATNEVWREYHHVPGNLLTLVKLNALSPDTLHLTPEQVDNMVLRGKTYDKTYGKPSLDEQSGTGDGNLTKRDVKAAVKQAAREGTG